MTHGSFKLVDTDELNAELTFSMRVADWKILRDQLKQATWPACDLSMAITELVHGLEKREIWTGKKS